MLLFPYNKGTESFSIDRTPPGFMQECPSPTLHAVLTNSHYPTDFNNPVPEMILFNIFRTYLFLSTLKALASTVITRL